VPYIYFQPEILRYLEVVSLVGATAVTLEPHIALLEKDLAEAQSIVSDRGKPLVALHPGAGSPDRRWPVEKFAAVGDAVAAAGTHIVVTGTQAESHLVEAVISNMKAEAQNLCGRLSLGGLAALLSRCTVLISNDSGPLHLAAAVGTATVGIFWCVNQITAGLLTRTRHRPLISWRLACPSCGSNQIVEPCQHHATYVADVPIEEVVGAAVEMLALSDVLSAT
jgi:ADP-heptose:LPS heptosyltransferase